MSKRSILYKNSWLYINLLKLLHGKNFSLRYKYMSAQVGKGVTVLEPGAGPAIIPSYLDSSCKYYGFDFNPDFVKSAKKRGIDIVKGNIRDKVNYKRSDVTILIDVIHHLNPENQKILIDNILKVTDKKIIICEPFMQTFPLISRLPFFSILHKKLFELMEQDGNNEARIEHVQEKDKLRQSMMDGFGQIPKDIKKEIKEMGDDLIVTYYLK